MKARKEFTPEQSDKSDPYITTFTGKKFYIKRPSVEMLCIEDIAHALSMQCRYNGHCPYYMSVAEHSVIMSELVPEEHALWGLLHDASECYIPDVPRPLKAVLTNLDAFEDKILKVVATKYGLPWPMPESVHKIDSQYVGTEARLLWKDAVPEWTKFYTPMEIELNFWTPKQAERAFIEKFEELYRHG